MNKYKMITICSLTIVCVLILSLLLPFTTSANDKESVELKMHYEKSTVTVDIAVNSEVYTGVVCKYIAIDNVLEYDDLSIQTKEKGKTLNLNKTEEDKYTTTIENVSNRYIVVYVSIGNCDICDYIDCKLDGSNQSTDNTNNNETPANTEENNDNQNASNENTDVTNNSQTDNQTTANNSEENNKSDANQSSEENNKSDANQSSEETSTENKDNESNSETTNNNGSLENEDDKIIVEDVPSSSQDTEFQNIESAQTNNVDIASADKDSINTDTFEAIQSPDTAKYNSTAEGNMPQTGENDGFKIVGIIIFSLIGIGSFYKYKKTK